MKARIFSALILVALVVPLSSCPRTPEVSPGVWLIFTDTAAIGVELLANGVVQTPSPFPPEATASFPFGTGITILWTQDGSTFTITHVADSDVFVYNGTVDSSTSIIDGTMMQVVGGTASGTWSGLKL
jgi:hypothetical protein